MNFAGRRKGVPDLHMPIPKAGFHGLYIEMKIPGGRVSDEQRMWIDTLKKLGHRVEVCYNSKEAKQAIADYLGLEGANV